MFNTGYKKVVINADEGITVNGSKVTIPGFGTYDKGNIVEILAAKEPVAEIATWAGLPSGGDYADVKIVLTGNTDDTRKTIAFNAKSSSEGDIVSGFDAWILLHNLTFNTSPVKSEATVKVSAGLTTTIQFGHENMLVSDIHVRPGTFDGIEKANASTRLVKTITAEAEKGYGMGWQIEESVKLGTATNYAAYNQQHGGNSHNIDLKAKYTTIFVKTPEADFAPWEQGEYIKHTSVGVDLPTTDIKWIIYVREDLADPLS